MIWAAGRLVDLQTGWLHPYVPVQAYLALAAVLFGIGAYGILTRRNVITVLMGMEIMLNSVNLMLVAFNRQWGVSMMRQPFSLIEGLQVEAPVGQVFVIFALTIAVAEAAIGFALVYFIYRSLGTVQGDRLNIMKW